mmetsp:Transcript_5035/g.12704  ORF Transcript_5035/g.12704 Transcript_5035/m.12704 type:complete len:191 (+) Transcript_5035:589-1161(+)
MRLSLRSRLTRLRQEFFLTMNFYAVAKRSSGVQHATFRAWRFFVAASRLLMCRGLVLRSVSGRAIDTFKSSSSSSSPFVRSSLSILQSKKVKALSVSEEDVEVAAAPAAANSGAPATSGMQAGLTSLLDRSFWYCSASLPHFCLKSTKESHLAPKAFCQVSVWRTYSRHLTRSQGRSRLSGGGCEPAAAS